ncbi:MAG: ABC transporter substrate-binding protein [Alphaproteobacteria bacterium]|nr:ABC transporter substrate-binding protein [Alphaproteobacteria bacterium]
MSGNTKEAGKALQRGIELALKEINDAGGINGVPLGLKIFDHRANPARGVYNIQKIAEDKDILAVIGGVHTPVALEQLPNIHKFKVPHLGAWAAGTTIVDNGYDPNYVFRLSVRDEYAAPFFIQEAQKRGYKNIVLFLEKTGWGRSNYKALTRDSANAGIRIEFTQWFFWGDKKEDFVARIQALKQYNVDAIILVANATEGAAFVKALAELPEDKRLPVISHWGITATDFPSFVGPAVHDIDLSFLQTWSFDHKGAKAFKEKYCHVYGPCLSTRDIPAPVGTAHSYDLTHIVAQALRKTPSLSRESLWDALHNVEYYDGLIKKYEFPFTKDDHEALDISNFGLYRYNRDGEIIKVNQGLYEK